MTKVEVSDQPIKAGADAKMKAKAGGQLIKEGEASSKEEAKADD